MNMFNQAPISPRYNQEESPEISTNKLNNVLNSLSILEDLIGKYSKEPLNENTATILAESNRARQIISSNISGSFQDNRGSLLENTTTLGTDGDPNAIINFAKETIKLLYLAKKIEGEELSRKYDVAPKDGKNKEPTGAFSDPLYRNGREERRSEPRPPISSLS